MKLDEKQRNYTIEGVDKYRKYLALFKHMFDTPRKPSVYNTIMLEGKCPKCGAKYFGWALQWPRNQTCSKCGTGLEITEDGMVFTGYSPFTAEEYNINPPTNVSHPEEKESRVKDE